MILPDSVTHIGSGAFASCGGVEDLIVPDRVEYLGMEPFPSQWVKRQSGDFVLLHGKFLIACNLQSERIVIPDTVQAICCEFSHTQSIDEIVIPGSVKTILAGTIDSVRKVVIEEGVEKIEAYAIETFSNNPVESIQIPSSVKEIEDRAVFESNGGLGRPDNATGFILMAKKDSYAVQWARALNITYDYIE